MCLGKTIETRLVISNWGEQEIKAIDVKVTESRRIAATAATLEEKLGYQKQHELEGKRSKLRGELYARQD